MSVGSEATERGLREPEAEVLRETVAAHTRKWMDHPSGDGFYLLDRTQGRGDLTVTSYSFGPDDKACRFLQEDDNPYSARRVLSYWESSSYPSRDLLPSGARDGDTRFTREWQQTVIAGGMTLVETFRGETPVNILFIAR